MRLFHCTWKAVLGRRLASPMCAFHLGISLVGFAVGLRLVEAARVSLRGLVDSRFWGRVLPELAGLGRMKVKSKVPPIAQVCGENDGRLCRAGCFRWSFAAQLA